jgi:hypothetical protein
VDFYRTNPFNPHSAWGGVLFYECRTIVGLLPCVNGFLGFSTAVDGFQWPRLCSLPSTTKPEFGEQNTASQMGTELQRRIERLSNAVARLEEAAQMASPSEGVENVEHLVQELSAVKDENRVLRSAHEAVMGRLDTTIARLRDVLGG